MFFRVIGERRSIAPVPPARKYTRTGPVVRDPPVPARNDLAWRRLASLVTWMAAGWAAALLYHHVAGAILGLPYPASTFLFDPGDRFNDLVLTWQLALAPDPYSVNATAAGGPLVAAYFPAVYAALRALRGAERVQVVLLYAQAALGAMAALGAAWIARERPRWQGDSRFAIAPVLVLFVVLANYPLLMALDRGSLEPLIVVFLAAALLALDAGRPVAGGVLLGLSAAAKGYPLVAALLWLRRGRPLGAAVAAGTLALLLVLPGLLFAGGVSGTLQGLSSGLVAFRTAYVHGTWSAHYSVDGLNALRIGAEALGLTLDPGRLVRAWEAFAAGWAALLCLDVLLVARGSWRQALAVTLIMLVFPNVANDYKVMVLIPVVLTWLSSDDAYGWRDRLFGACAALLFVPKHYGPALAWRDATISCLVSPVLVLGLTVALWPTVEERDELRQRLARASSLLRRARAAPGAGGR